MSDVIDRIRGGVIVSSQAPDGSPLRDSETLARLAHAAVRGGARAVRANGPEDIRAIRARVDVPIIGLHKVFSGRRNVITPTLDLARVLVAAGADIIAIDATREVLGDSFEYVRHVSDALGVPVMADVSTHEEGIAAWAAGAAVIGTTLSGYTPDSVSSIEPDLELARSLAEAGILVVAEGRYSRPEQVRAAFGVGAMAVVIGGAITDATAITLRFVAATL